MSSQIFLERVNSLPNPTTPDTLYLIAFATGQLKLSLTNATNVLVYSTIVGLEVQTLIETELAKPGGILSIINLLQADQHSHPNPLLLNLLTTDVDGYLEFNGHACRPLLVQEDW